MAHGQAKRTEQARYDAAGGRHPDGKKLSKRPDIKARTRWGTSVMPSHGIHMSVTFPASLICQGQDQVGHIYDAVTSISVSVCVRCSTDPPGLRSHVEVHVTETRRGGIQQTGQSKLVSFAGRPM